MKKKEKKIKIKKEKITRKDSKLGLIVSSSFPSLTFWKSQNLIICNQNSYKLKASLKFNRDSRVMIDYRCFKSNRCVHLLAVGVQVISPYCNTPPQKKKNCSRLTGKMEMVVLQLNKKTLDQI